MTAPYPSTWDRFLRQQVLSPRSVGEFDNILTHRHAWSSEPAASGGTIVHPMLSPNSYVAPWGAPVRHEEPAHAGSEHPAQDAVHDLLQRFAAAWVRAQKALIEEHAKQQEAMHRALKLARATVISISSFEDDWDSYGGLRPTAVAIGQAIAVLDRLDAVEFERTGDALAPWATAPLADGGVQFEWRKSNAAIEVEIAPDGDLIYLVEESEQTVRRTPRGETAPLDEVIEQIRSVVER